MPNIIIEPHVNAFLEKHSKRWGVKIIRVLLAAPDEPVQALKLTHLIDPPAYEKLSFVQAERLLNRTEDIPQTDGITLKQVNDEMNRLIKVKAHMMEAGISTDTEDFIIEMLAAYHRETTRPNGTIKNFRTANEREYQRHQAAIKRLLSKAKKECPEAYAYITAHLKTGLYFKWDTSADLNPSAPDTGKAVPHGPRVNTPRRC